MTEGRLPEEMMQAGQASVQPGADGKRAAYTAPRGGSMDSQGRQAGERMVRKWGWVSQLKEDNEQAKILKSNQMS